MLRNLLNNKCYIGKDQYENEYYMGSGLYLWNSYRKRFGDQSLTSNKRTDHRKVYELNKKLNYYEKTILDRCDNAETLCELEKYYIDKYDTIRPKGYNIAEGGEGGCLIKGYTEEEKKEWKNKISEKTKEAMWSDDVRQRFLSIVQNKNEEWKKNISKSLTGRKRKPLSEDTREKLRRINIGNNHGIGNKSRTGMHNSEEMNRKISEGAKKVVHTKEWNKRVSDSLRGKPKSEAHKEALRKPKPRYKWLLPDGTIIIMDASNGSRHKDWIRKEKIV